MRNENCITTHLVGLVVFTLLLVGVTACAPIQPTAPSPPPPPPPEIPTSSWGNNYHYTYELPEGSKQPPASVPATLIVVNPIYKVEESALKDKLYSKVGKGFSASMGLDLEKVIVAKGMTAKGPYSTLDEITYSDKKGSDLTLVPRVFVITRIKYDENVRRPGQFMYKGRKLSASVKAFEMKVSGWIAFLMKEPLSKETMWIKKLELDDVTVTGEEYYESIARYERRLTERWGLFNEMGGNPYQHFVGYKTGKLLYDGKADALANILKEIYSTAMKKVWMYIDPNEVLDLKTKVAEIRNLKRY